MSTAPSPGASGGEQSGASGEITIYSPGAQELDTVFAAFNKEYPNIKINPVRLVGQEIPTRLQSEFTSGQHVGDLVIGSVLTSYGLWGDGKSDAWFERYVPEGAEALPSYAVDVEAGWFAPYSSGIGVAYNTNKVSAADAPQSWEDLIDPKWKGKILLPDPTTLGLPAVAFAGLSHEGVIDDDWLKALVAQDPQITESSSSLGQALATGRGDVAVWGSGYVFNAAATGAPVAFVGTTTTQTVTPTALVSNAPNAAAAKVFLDWLITDAAQEALAASGYIPLMPDQPLPDGITAEQVANSTVVPTYGQGGFAEAQRQMALLAELLG
ncbi:ABC transporter substrate-binding protein [Rhodococcus koreensis]